ncbi:MAG: UDP-galactopyranose mutase [Clostridiales Family XIII bacterium]|jgi:UDP-galactopyranose mutase|nr:UDP-galactopyranose mutase [Clostridiales Family XIII bacterium]
MYDYLIVGAGLSGATFAYEAKRRGKSCLVLERREHFGGNVYCESIENIHVHKYGAHIFHTHDKDVWEYVHRFADFNHYVNSPVANYKGEMLNLPFNMNTFSKLWGVRTPEEAMAVIAEQRKEITGEPQNLEEQAISLVGRDIYEKLIRGYTEKQWGRKCTELPSFIISRLPVRFTYDNNYFNDPYQGIPIGGYNKVIEGLLDGIPVELSVDFTEAKTRELYAKKAKRILYTGMIDAYFGYEFGNLEYRSLRFESKTLDTPNFQGVAVVNYTDAETPFTRVIEHKHFEFGTQEKTVVTYEYPCEWTPGTEAYYPVNDEKNTALYAKYRALAEAETDVFFLGRLAEYKYSDMDDAIAAAYLKAQEIL